MFQKRKLEKKLGKKISEFKSDSFSTTFYMNYNNNDYHIHISKFPYDVIVINQHNSLINQQLTKQLKDLLK
jgi:hypothetical protein